MSDERWTLTVTPTAAETYEAMVVAGRALFRGRNRAFLLLHSTFVIIFAPLGASMILWVAFSLSSNTSETFRLPAAVLPITFLAFGGLSFWLLRQTYVMIAQAAARSRFGHSQEVTLDKTGITLVTENSRWHSGWGDVALVRGGKQVLVVGISGIAIALPRRAFLGPKDADDALAILQAWQEAAQ